MKHLKSIILLVMIVALVATCTACSATRVLGNRAVGGSDIQTFHYAYVYLGGVKIDEGKVTQWRDYDDSDVVQVLMNGKYYLTHYTNVVLVADPEMGAMGYDWSGDYN